VEGPTNDEFDVIMQAAMIHGLLPESTDVVESGQIEQHSHPFDTDLCCVELCFLECKNDTMSGIAVLHIAPILHPE